MSRSFLDQILLRKRAKLALQKDDTDLSKLRSRALQTRRSLDDHRLSDALRRENETNIIAEIKRASPSKGKIADHVDIRSLAKSYRAGGAAALSVLTEEEFFDGSLQDLLDVRNAVDLPILRKDFLFDEFQIYESAAAGADGILLIVAALSEADLRGLLRLAEDELGMDAIVEVHTQTELAIAERAGARIIGVNNRDLASFVVSLDVSRKLIASRSPGSLMISESGISLREEIAELEGLGFDGFLIGETLMRSDDAAAALSRFRGAQK